MGSQVICLKDMVGLYRIDRDKRISTSRAPYITYTLLSDEIS